MSASVASSNFFGSFGRKAALAWGWGKGLMGPITNVVMCCKYVQLLLSLFLMAKWLTNGGTFGVHDFRNQWGTVWGHWYIYIVFLDINTLIHIRFQIHDGLKTYDPHVVSLFPLDHPGGDRSTLWFGKAGARQAQTHTFPTKNWMFQCMKFTKQLWVFEYSLKNPQSWWFCSNALRSDMIAVWVHNMSLSPAAVVSVEVAPGRNPLATSQRSWDTVHMHGGLLDVQTAKTTNENTWHAGET